MDVKFYIAKTNPEQGLHSSIISCIQLKLIFFCSIAVHCRLYCIHNIMIEYMQVCIQTNIGQNKEAEIVPSLTNPYPE